MQVLRNYSKCDLAHRFFKGKGKEEHVKECIRPESLITPRFIRKLSTGRTGPTIYIKVQAKKGGGGAGGGVGGVKKNLLPSDYNHSSPRMRL